jgi:DNA-binding LacI/PurR family transcriptional regulator
MCAVRSAVGATPAIVALADRLEADIRKRGLASGDPYLSAAEAARWLRTSTSLANRALQLLQQRQVLIRRQRTGSVIAAAAPPARRGTLGRVNLIVARNFLQTEGLLADGVVVGMQGVLPAADFQFRFMPAGDESAWIGQVVAEALRSNLDEAFVLVRTSLAVQRQAAASGLPVVVYGTPYPSLESLCWIDRDNAQVAQRLIDYLRGEGAQQIALYLRQQVMPGDHVLLDAARQRMSDSPLGSNALLVRCLPADRDVVCRATEQLLASADRPLGILCRSEPLAEAAAAAIPPKRRGRTAPRVPIAVADVYRRAGQSRWPHARMQDAPEQVGRQIGEMLLAQTGRRRGPPVHRLLPVELFVA